MKQNQSSMGWLFLYLHLFLFYCSSFSSSFNFSCHHDESSALLQFKSSLSVYHYCEDYGAQKITTWKNETDCCSWHGVTCDSISSHVIGLNLGNECLYGILDPNDTLFHLPHLQILNLSFIQFSEFHFLSTVGGFSSLTHLDLSWCNFEGEVPSQISHLSKLTSLDLSGNNALRWKETTLKRIVQNATNLKELILQSTNLSSIRPNSMELIFNHSSSLVTLDLSYTGLSGNFKNNNLCLPGIQKLDLSYNFNLKGQLTTLSCSTSLSFLDLSNCQFEGPILLSFFNLTYLTYLSLGNNHLKGLIPSSLSKLQRLIFLDLSYNSLSGQIPSSLSKLQRLIFLDLSYNSLSGQIPSSLSKLQRLIFLDLSYNSLSGQIPDMFVGMTKLQKLYLTSNNIQGQIPSSLFNLTQLVTLNCSYNKLEGPIPNKIVGFQKLTFLSLSYNLLNGLVPSWCFSLKSLKYLDFSYNQFRGSIGVISSYSLETLSLCHNELHGSIPKSIFSLANLTLLCLSSNNLSGVVNFQHFSKFQNLKSLSLSQNSQLSLNFESNGNYNFSQLTELHLSSLSLTQIPKLSRKPSNLKYIDLSDNKINGSVPNWLLETMDSSGFMNLSQNLFTSIDEISSKNKINWLISLDLSFNLLQGELSASICYTSSLGILNLAHNKLTGIIPPCLANLEFLEVLDLQMNNFHGTLPNNFPKDSVLFTLNLNDNQLEGRLPVSLSNCIFLSLLNLGNNKIEDNFPHWLQTLEYLSVLVLRDNKLYGPIADINSNISFSSLIILDISRNNFSGPLPKTFLKDNEAMIADPQGGDNRYPQYMDMHPFNYANYNGSVTVGTKGINMTLVKIPTVFVTIDLSRNQFEGEIPDVLGELHLLKGLNLSHNRFTGPIPRSMRNLKNLESLDLSSNMLNGVIPAELTNLISLEVLNLSNNHLVGEIPQGKQFNTFSNNSYENNSGLCGFPLTNNCGPQQHSSPSPEEKFGFGFGFGWKPVAIGYGCGMMFGICMGCCVLLMGKPRWLVVMVGGQPKRRVKRRTRVRRAYSPTMNQMVQMS